MLRERRWLFGRSIAAALLLVAILLPVLACPTLAYDLDVFVSFLPDPAGLDPYERGVPLTCGEANVTKLTIALARGADGAPLKDWQVDCQDSKYGFGTVEEGTYLLTIEGFGPSGARCYADTKKVSFEFGGPPQNWKLPRVGDCGPRPGDAGLPDARPPDARPPDARPPDARPPDARPPDARPPDAGTGPGRIRATVTNIDRMYGNAFTAMVVGGITLPAYLYKADLVAGTPSVSGYLHATNSTDAHVFPAGPVTVSLTVGTTGSPSACSLQVPVTVRGDVEVRRTLAEICP